MLSEISELLALKSILYVPVIMVIAALGTSVIIIALKKVVEVAVSLIKSIRRRRDP